MAVEEAVEKQTCEIRERSDGSLECVTHKCDAEWRGGSGSDFAASTDGARLRYAMFNCHKAGNVTIDRE